MNNQTQPPPVRLLLLDELALFRASLAHFLSREPGFEVVGECGTSADALTILKSVPIDVIVLDFEIGAEHGNEFICAAREAGYQGHYMVLSATLDLRKSAVALKLGATGIFLKSEALERLVEAIRLVAKGQAWVDSKVIQLLAEQALFTYPRLEGNLSLTPLGERERNVLLGIVRGFSNRKIGDSMGLSESSVKNIVQRLFAITGVKTRGQLVRVALEGSFDVQQFANPSPELLSNSVSKSHERA